MSAILASYNPEEQTMQFYDPTVVTNDEGRIQFDRIILPEWVFEQKYKTEDTLIASMKINDDLRVEVKKPLRPEDLLNLALCLCSL